VLMTAALRLCLEMVSVYRVNTPRDEDTRCVGKARKEIRKVLSRSLVKAA